jgi:CRP-like cAMP-binding protein
MPASPPTSKSLFRELSPAQRDEAMAQATVKLVDKDQVLFEEDEPAEALYLVESGRLKLAQTTASGDSVTVRLAGPGELCAALAVLDGRPYPFTATASEPTRVRRWTARALRDLFRRHPRLEANVLGVVGSHSREMIERFRELATEPVPQRVARAILRLAAAGGREGGDEAALAVTQQDLAELTGTTLYTVNRLLSEWESAGLVQRGRGRLLLRSPAGLKRIAEPPAP